WNSMMSMAGGWFFLTVTEAFTLGDRDFRLPGIGAYMAAAVDAGDSRAVGAAIVAMIVMIVLVDQLLWRPALAWAQRFKVEEASAVEVPRSAVLELLRRSRVIALARRTVGRQLQALRTERGPGRELGERGAGESVRRLGVGGFAVGALLVTAWGGVELVLLLRQVPVREWAILAGCLAL